MSLDVSAELLAAAEGGEVSDEQFAACVRDSLPDNTTPPPSEKERGQLLRALASDSIRGVLERHFGVRLAFQNCHRVAVFPADDGRPGLESGDYLRFVSVRAQLLNQSPELRDC
jgi:hypothetical protein